MILRLLFMVVFGFLAKAQSTNDGSILLHSSKAIVHGEKLRYEPETNKLTLGYWTNPNDWAEWKFVVDRPGVFELEVWQGCGKGNGGSDVRVEVAGQNFDFVVDETGHFQSFIPRRIGKIHFWKAGDYTLAIKPQNKKAAAVMDVRQVQLLRMPVEPEGNIEQEILKAGRIIFLGDSITHAGDYVTFLETYLRLKYPNAEFDLINLGLPSETVSGLSEEGHAGGAFPRPDLHERLDRVLAQAKPDLIFACYGMNDGIYQALNEERFAKFKNGIELLRKKASDAGAKVIHLTPPTFDPIPLQGKASFEGYNEVLDAYSEWLISKHADGWEVIDIHGPMNAYLMDKRRDNPKFALAGDGVHAGKEGHWLMAQGVLGLGLEEPDALKRLSPRANELMAMVQKRQQIRRDTWLEVIGHKRPGMNKGTTIELAERTANIMAGEIAKLQNPQLPGNRMLWNGFESVQFIENEKAVRIVIPKHAPEAGLWIAVTNFEQNIRAAGLGFHLVQTDSPEVETTLVAKHSFKDRVFSEKMREVIEKHVKGPKDESGRPLIRKLGTVDLDLVETTPVVINNRLWRFEWVREGYWDNKRKTNYFRFRDPSTREVTEAFADGHEFGSAFVQEGMVYVTGTFGRGEVNVFASRDLKNWEKWNAIPNGKYGIFNTSVCKAGEDFVLMFEIDKPSEEAGIAFTARFAKSKDLKTWRMTPPEMNYAKDRYTAPHALRWLDGWFYNFYLEAHNGYEMRVVRSRDLIKWEPSPLNPVLKASPEDERIANPAMQGSHATRVANAINLNNSDIDFCESGGRLQITYSWGNQQGIEHLAEAIYDGTEAEFLRGWFP